MSQLFSPIFQIKKLSLREKSNDSLYIGRDFPAGAVIGTHLPVQGTQVWSLVWEDPMRCAACGLVCNNNEPLMEEQAGPRQ